MVCKDSQNERIISSLDSFEALVNEVQSLRHEFRLITEQAIPQLERETRFAHMEELLVKPHRNHIAEMRQELRVLQEKRQAELVSRTVGLLESDIDLTCSLRLLSTLKQQKEFMHNPTQLIKLFLGARARFISKVITETIPEIGEGVDAVKQYTAVFKVMQGPVLEVVHQYRAAFSDLAPLARFIIERFEWFCGAVEQLVACATSTLMLASFWNQAVLLDANYTAVGTSFLKILEPAFVKRASDLLAASTTVSLKLVKGKYGNMKPPVHSTLASMLKPSQRAGSVGKDLHPPHEITAHPGLTLMMNILIEVFEQARVFAIPCLKDVVQQSLALQLNQFREMINSDDQLGLELFNKFIPPFVESVVAIYFPSKDAYHHDLRPIVDMAQQ